MRKNLGTRFSISKYNRHLKMTLRYKGQNIVIKNVKGTVNDSKKNGYNLP